MANTDRTPPTQTGNQQPESDGPPEDKTPTWQTIHRQSFPLDSESSDPLIVDGFSLPDLEVPEEAPPAYGELPDQLQFSQAGFEAGAVVTGMSSLCRVVSCCAARSSTVC